MSQTVLLHSKFSIFELSPSSFSSDQKQALLMGKPHSSGKISLSLIFLFLFLSKFSLSIPLYPNGNPSNYNHIQSVCTKNRVSEIGVCYGVLGTGLPSAEEVIDLYIKNNIRKMRIYYPHHAVLQALRDTNIELMVGIPNEKLQRISTNQTAADSWIQNYVKGYEGIIFKYIVVGNNAIPSHQFAQFLYPALNNIQNALSSAGLGKRVKVSTAVSVYVLDQSVPPSSGSFTNQSLTLLVPIIQFLSENQSPLLVNLYPYYNYFSNSTTVSLDYALLASPSIVRFDGQLAYRNLFDEMLDAFYWALERAGGERVEIVVSETGWPSNGGVGASVENAWTYNNNVIQHVKGGTPKRPGKAVETYIFIMFDETDKSLPWERYWGIFLPNKLPKYPITFN